MSKAVVIVSGGMDSVCLAHILTEAYDEMVILSFNYGQRHKKELQFAEACADRLGATWHLVELQGIRPLLKGSALTDDSIDVPEGHYAEESMKLTVVPNRNAIMLAIATGVAVAEGADAVFTAVHSGDHAIYPDCRPQFITMFSQAMQLGTEGFHAAGFTVEAPFAYIPKQDIVSTGEAIKNPVPWDQTWSCYKGGDIHCGKCGTCVERREAFSIAGVKDPTAYECNYEEA